METTNGRHSMKCHDGRSSRLPVGAKQNLHHQRPLWLIACLTIFLAVQSDVVSAGGGIFVLSTEDEQNGLPVVSTIELFRADGKPQIVRQVASAGRGFVISESVELALPDGNYRFQLKRGPEYRIIQGNFTLERTSDDQRTVRLPRMVDMKSEGWLSCDMAVPPLTNDVRLRMAAEDLHYAAIAGTELPPRFPKSLPRDLTPYAPLQTADSVESSHDQNALFYRTSIETRTDDLSDQRALPDETTAQTIRRLATDDSVRIAVANPFAWELPLWIANDHVDGIFVLGEWLREDRRVEKMTDARPANMIGFDGPRGLGRYGEHIYWNVLEAGLRIAPLAGSGATKGNLATTTLGYNRVYARIDPQASSNANDERSTNDVFDAVWNGRSVITNGPMLRPSLDGYAPGHVFKANAGEELELGITLDLAVRDQVEYLEVIHNGRSFHSARLDEFAKAGGQLPELKVTESGWALVRVVTTHEDHYRMATSAPWFFEFDSKPRISREAVMFFGQWLVELEQRLKQLPAEELAKHVEPVIAARNYWKRQFDAATAD